MIYIVFYKREEKMVHRVGFDEVQHYAHMKDFLPLLEQRGDIVVIRNAQREVEPIYNFLDFHGHPCLYIFFSPPDGPYNKISCPKIFIAPIDQDQLPPFSIEGVQGSLAGITFCEESVDILKQKASEESILSCIPPPIWDEYQALYDEKYLAETVTKGIETNGNIIDTDIPNLQPAYSSYKIPWASRLLSILHAIRYFKSDIYSLRLSIGKRRQVHYYATKVELSGIVYTTLINPKRPHKDWKQLILDFCHAFRYVKDATLVIKVAGTIEHKTKKANLRLIRKLSVDCRIIFLYCHLDQHQYQKLIRATTYVINASSTRVLGSSLMEFMSAGKPAISPPLTPHSPLNQHNTFFTDGQLKASLTESYNLAKNQPEQYQQMSASATKAQKDFCSKASIETRFNTLMDTVESKLPRERIDI